MINLYQTVHNRISVFKLIGLFFYLLVSGLSLQAQTNGIISLESVDSSNTQSVNSSISIIGNSSICLGTKTSLRLRGTCSGKVIWKTTQNNIIGTGSMVNVSPKVTTSYFATCKAIDVESKTSNILTVNVNTPKFNGLPNTPANYEIVSKDPFYLGVKSSNTTPLRWKHENSIGNETLIKPTADSQTYYVRYEESESGCVSAWKPVTVRLVAENKINNIPEVKKGAKIAANTPASSCASMASSSDAQLCSNTTFPALVNNTTDGGTGATTWGCLRTRPNQSWFYFIPLTSGSVSFAIGNTAGVDIDGAVWGPVNSVADACVATQSSPLSCDYSTSANVPLTIASVTAGKVYVIVITNYSNRATTVNFPSNSGTASIGCCTLTGLTASATAITCNGGTSTATVSYTGTPTGTATYSKDGVNYQASNVFSGLSAGTYTFYVKDNFCTKFNSITISQPTSISFGSPTVTNVTCTGNSNGKIVVSASGGTGSISYSISPSIGSQSPSGTFNNLTAGSYTITATDANGCTATTTANVSTTNITPNAPTAISASPATICSGQSSTLSANCATGTTTWYSDVNLTTTITNTVSPSASTTYYVACVSGGVCKSPSGNITVTVNQTPTAPTSVSASPATICSGQSSTLSATCATGTTTWYSDAALTSVIASPSPATPSSTTTYYVACVSGAGCKSTSGSVTVTVNPTPNAPTAISASPATICSGQSSTLSANCATGTVTWYSNSGLTNIIASPSPATPSTTTTYYVACVSSAGCKSSGGNVTITVNQTPTAPTSVSASPATICSGQSSTLSATCATGTTTWYSDAALTSVMASPSPATPSTTTTYYVACVSGAGCKSTSGSVTVTVNPTPNAPTAISASPATICSGQSSTLSANCATGTVTWYSNSGLTNIITSPSPATPSTTTTYYVACVSSAGCKSSGGNVTITVNQTPTAPTAISASPATICSGQSSTLSATCATGTTTWYSDAVLTNVVSSPVNPTSTTTYYVSCVSGAGCKSISGNVTVTVNPTPTTPTAISASPATICSGQSSTLSATCATGTATWYSNSGLTTTVTSPVSPTSTTTYYVACVSNAGCKSTSGNITVTVNPTPSAPINAMASPATICSGQSSTLSATCTTGTVTWYSDAALTNVLSSTTVSPTANTSYYVSCVSGAGCKSSSVNVGVAVNQTPSAPTAVSASPTTICSGQISTLSATCATGTAIWYTNAGLTTTVTSPVSPTSTTSYYVACVSSTGCKSSAMNVGITVNPTPPLPTVNSVQYCQGDTPAQLVVTASSGATVLWYNVATGGTSSTTAPTPSTVTAGTTNYYVSQILNSCETERVTLAVVVNQNPALSLTAGNITCAGSGKGTIIANTTGGTPSYTYSKDNGVTFQSGNVFSGINAGTYNIIAKDSKGCINTQSIVVTQSDPIVLLSETTNDCTLGNNGIIKVSGSGGTAPLTYNLNGGTYGASTVFSNLSSGVYTIGVKDANGCTLTNSVSVNSVPDLTITLDSQNDCIVGNTGSITVVGNGGTSPYNFRINGGTWGGNTFNSLSAGTYTIDVLDARNCMKSLTVTITENPSAPTTTSPTICLGESTTLSGTCSSGVINWYADASLTTPLSTTTVTPSVTTTYYATCEIASVECISSSSTSIVTVNPIPTVNVVSNQVLCKGTSSTAIAFSGADTGTIFSWTNNNANIGLATSGSGDILPFTSTNSGVVPINGTIMVTPTFTNNEVTCTGLPTNFTITVNPIPTVNTVTNIAACNTSTVPTVSFSGTVASTVYSWTNSNTNIGLGASGTGDITAFSATNSTTSPITGNVTVTPSFTSSSVTCTGSPKTFAIAVNPTPTVNAVANQTLCNGSSTTAISFTGAVAGTVYSWTNTNPNIGLAESGIGNMASFSATNSGVLPISGTITITPSYTNNGITCTGTPQNFTITVNPTPTVNPISNQTLCDGSATNAIGFTGAVSRTTYSWTNTNSNIGLAVSGSGDIPTFNVTNSTNSTILGTISVIPSFTNNGVTCTGTSQNFTITVNPIPTVNTVSNQTLCNGSATTAINFTGAVTGTIYSWTNTNANIGLASSGAGNITTFTATNATNAPISGTITVTPTFTNNGVTCTGTSKNVAITVNPTPSVNSISNQTLCNGSATTAVNFTGAVTGTTYAWTNTNASIGLATSGSGDIPTFTATNATNASIAGTITVTPSFTNNGVTCTGASQNFTITVNPIPTVNTVTNKTLCHGTSTTAINFTGNVSNTVYSWTNTNTSIGLGDNGTGNISAFTAINSGTTVSTGTITVTPTFTNNGVSCVGTSKNFTISVNPIPSVNAISDQLVCNNSATTAVSFSGAVAGTSYDWTNTNTNIGLAASGSGNIPSFTAQNSTNSPISGTITVIPNFTNNGVTCTNTSQSFNIAVNPTPTVNNIANQSLCNGATTSAISFTGSVAGTVYSWTNSNIGIGLSSSGTGDIPAFSVTNTGSTSILGTITVTPSYSNNGLTCVGLAKTFTISANPIPKATITPDVINICSGDNVSLSITDEKAVSGSTSYSWSRDNTSNLTGLAVGGSVTSISGIVTNVTSSTQISVIIANVTSQFGCNSMGIAKIAVTPPLIVTISGNTFFCGTGQINKFTTLTASPVGGTGSYSYQWNLNGTAISGATSSTYDASNAGDYTVTVVSEFCTKTSNTITVNDPYNLSAQPTVTPSSSAICGSGTVRLTASSTSNLGTFNWYNTPTSLSQLSPTSGTRNEVYNTPTLNSSQTYYVARIYSVVGSIPLISCETDRTSVNITVNSTPTTPVATGSVVICKGGNTDLILSSGCTGTITWKNATTNAVVGTGSPLNVSPTVTTGYNATCSENGCLSNNSNTVTVTVSNITLSATPTNLTCKANNSGQITLTASGGTSAYSYSIDGTNFQSSNTFSGLSAGAYTLTVKDANACSATTTVTLTEPAILGLTETHTNLTCKANASGQITLTASGGTTAYSYSIDGTNFQSSNTFTSLSAGAYTLTVKDANACLATTTVTLTEPNTLTLSANQVNLTCKTNASGQIALTASGGTTAYSYSTDGTNFQSGNTFTGLSAGAYTLTVKDANACLATTTVTLTEPNSLTLSATPTNLTCKANNSGQIALTATGGTTAYSYSIDGTNFQTSNSFTGLSARAYTLTVKDANACLATTTVTLTEPNTLTLSANQVNLTCKTNASGQIALTATGGTTAYSYSIDGTNFQTSNSFTGLSAGAYTLTVKDANACLATTTVTLTEPNSLTLSATPTNLTCKTNASGQIALTATGGTSAYTYSKDGTNFQSSNTFTGLSAGNYTLTVKDANACLATTTVTLTEPAVLTLSATHTNLTCKANASGQIALTASGGTTAYSYSIDGTNFQSSNTFTGLSAGAYTLTVKDANACLATTTVTLTEPAVLTISATPTNLTCKTNASGQIALTATGGTSAYTYSKDGTNFQASNTFTGLSAGAYTLTVKDANACLATTTVTLTEPAVLGLSETHTNLTCKANNSGQIALTATGGTTAYSYSIDGTNFQTSNSFTGLSAGAYTLTIKDANACLATTTVTLTEPNTLTLSATPTNLTCKTNASGQIALTATGGTTAYSYSIDGTNFQSSNTFTGLSAGAYTLTVKDANACLATTTVTLTEPNSLTLSATPTNLTCKTNASGQIALTATGGTTAYSYSIDGTNFQTSNSFTGLSAGAYTLTVKDANACLATTTVTLTEPAVLTLSATHTNLTCKANASGQIALTATGGTSAYTYSKDGTNFQASNTFTGLSAGAYTLTVKDANACLATTTVTLTEPAVLGLSETHTNLTCKANNSGQIALTATGGTTAYSYSIDGTNFQTSNSFTGLSAGAYTLTVKDANACLATTTVTLTEPNTLTLSATPTNLTCKTNASGQIALTATGGTSAYSYSIDGTNFQSSNTFTGLSAGAYTLTVKDANTCSATTTVTLTEPNTLTLSASQVNLTCKTNASGQIALTATGGTTAYSYSIDGTNFQASNTFTGLSAGAYTLTVKDANTCSTTTSVTLTEPNTLTLSATPTNLTCKANASGQIALTATGGTSAYSYSIDGTNFQNSNTFTGLSAGNYTLTVKDANACLATTTVTLTEPNTLTLSANQVNLTCKTNASGQIALTATGGTTAYTYSIDGTNFQTSNSFTGLSAGAYTLTVKDANACLATTTVTLTEPNTLTLSATPTNLTCKTNASGQIALTATGGTTAYSYSIDGTNFQSSNTFTGLSAGAYTLTVKDANACLATTTVTLTEPAVLTISATPTNLTCKTNASGQIALTATGGTTAYSYSTDGTNFQSSNTFTGLSAGNYTLTVKDANACLATTTVTLTEPNTLTLSASQVNLTCKANASGQITLTASGGTLAYSYSIDGANFQSSNTFTGLSAGNYTLTVKDANACLATTTVTLTEPNTLTLSATPTNLTCKANNSGQIALTATGGTTAYSYSIDGTNFQSGNTFTSLSAGAYTLTVKDANACLATTTVTLTEPNTLTLSATPTNLTCKTNASGQIALTASGGTTAYSYSTDGTNFQSSNTFTGLSAGAYTLTVKDANACLATTTVTLTEPAVLGLSETHTNLTCKTNASGQIALTATGGTTAYSYSIDGTNFQSSNTFTGLSAGAYTLTVKDANACLATTTVTLTEPAVLTISATPTNLTCKTNASGQIALTATGGTTAYSYSIDGTNFQSSNTFTGLSAGNYTLTVKDANACLATTTVTLTEPNTLTLSATPTNLTCKTNASGQIALTASGGTTAYSYSTDGTNFQSSNTFTSLSAGAYTLTVKDANACLATTTVTLTEPNTLTLSATPTNLTCKTNASGQIALTATGGTTAYTYSIDGTNFQSSNTFTGLSAGAYTLTVKDANACLATTTVTLTEPAVLTISATPTNLTCKTNASGQIALTATGGTSAYTYSKDGTNFQSSNTFTGLSAGAYTLTVKDANACLATTTVTLTESNTLTLSANQVNLTCKSNASGQITLTASGGTTAYSYSIDGTNFQASNTFTGLSAGAYTLTVKDANACLATTTVTLTEPNTLTLSASQVNLTCKANNSGKITLTASGGTSAYSYSIDGTNFQSSNSFTGLSAGAYTLTVKDANACLATTTVTLTEPNTLTLSATPTNLTCKTNASGQIALTATGGTTAYTYSIDGTNFQTSNSFTGLSAGNYTLTVKDANVCLATTTVTLTEPNTLTLSANQVNLTCKGNNSGQIALTATGGTTAYSYSIDGTNFQSSNTFTGLSAGAYTLTVKDANACLATTTVILTEPAVLGLSETHTNLTCKANNSGQIALTATGGTTAYTYSIDGTNFQSSNTFTGLSAGNYTLTVKDANVCLATTTVTLTEPAVLGLSETHTNLTCKANNSGQIALTATGGTTAYTYSIDGTNFQSGNTFTGLSAGAYTLTVKDANACLATTTAIIADGKNVLAPSVSGDISVCLGSSLSLSNITFDNTNKLLWYANNVLISAPLANVIGKMTYTVSQLSPEGCESAKTSVNIIVSDCTPAVFDLALRKTIADTNRTYKPNDIITFNVTIFNQGDVKAYNIDVIDYIPQGLSFISNNSKWTQSDGNAINRIDSLSAKDSLNLKISLRVNADAQNGNLLNKAEIFGADLDKSGKIHVTSDIDSRFDKNPNNDIGGKENSPTDNVIWGDGDGRYDVVRGIDPKHDEDDEDPAQITVFDSGCFDLALRKQLISSPVTAMYLPNDSLRFEITVFNQCKTQKAYNIDVVDYLPKETTLVKTTTINQRWISSIDTLFSINKTIISIDTNAVTRIDSLAGGDSTKFEITLKVKPNTLPGAYVNKAEIFKTSLDKAGKYIVTNDRDSRFDKNPNNDIGGKENSPSDDVILGDGDGKYDVVGGIDPKHDEDDEDPAMFVIGSIDCLVASVDSVQGNKWFNLYDKYGRLYASVNPNGQNLGKVTLQIRHYGNGASKIPVTSFGTQLMSRYYDIKSSLKDSFDVAVSVRTYYLNTELNDYKKATNLPLLTINDFNIVHYEGVRENCGFEDNDNFTSGRSEVLYKNIIGQTFTNESFYLQFNLTHFSELGATANKYATTLVYDVNKRDEKSAIVNWKTDVEIRSNYYIVERSNDCVHFEEIGRVTAVGTGNAYEFVDHFPMGGINCYRIIYVDKDGTRKVFDPKQVEFDNLIQCSVFPNPLVSFPDFDLYFKNIEAKEIKIYNVLGQNISFDYSIKETGLYKISTMTPLHHTGIVVIYDDKGNRCVVKVASKY